MTEYLLLDLVFLLPAALLWAVFENKHLKSLLLSIIVLVLTTTVFDNLIIGLHIVKYHHNHLLGLFVGTIPVEDYAYAVAAVLLLPTIFAILNTTIESK